MGHVRLPNTILKMGCQELAPSLTHLFNKCIEECCWPTEWEKGEWVPIMVNKLTTKRPRRIIIAN